MELPNGDIHTYTWNSDHRRIAKEDEAGNVTSFLWDRNNILEESDDLDNVEVEYTYKPEEYGALVSQYATPETEPAYYHFDALGSTIVLTDEMEAVTDNWSYKAFGNENSRTGITATPYRWIGEQGYCWDEDTEKHHLRRRMYDSETAKFGSIDPIYFLAEEFNLYRYVRNQVLGRVDPLGLLDQSVIALSDQGIPGITNDSTFPEGGGSVAFGVYTQWKLEKDEINGVIIQKVSFRGKVESCDGTPLIGYNIKTDNKVVPRERRFPDGSTGASYYEIWRVKDRQIYEKFPLGAAPQHFQNAPYQGLDLFAIAGFQNCSKGFYEQTGEAIFIPDALWTPFKVELGRRFRVNEFGIKNAGSLASTLPDTLLDNQWENWKLDVRRPGVKKLTIKKVTRTWDGCPSNCTAVDPKTGIIGTIELVVDGQKVEFP